MNKFGLYIAMVAFLLGSVHSFAQVEEEIAFQYMKAKYLLETDRHEDAVNAFNKIIKQDPSYEDALVLRAAAKYGLAAYRGSTKDLLQAIELKGITPDAASWLALSFDKEGKEVARDNTLASALILNPSNDKIWMLQASIHDDNMDMKAACSCWYKASELGNSKAARKLKANCNSGPTKQAPVVDKESDKKEDEVISVGTRLGDDEPEEDTNEDDRVITKSPGVIKKPGSSTSTNEPKEDETKADDMPDHEVISVGTRLEEDEEEEPKEDLNKKNVIEVDEDLTLEIYGEGLGSRRILDQPNILMLADEDGEVVIDICVSRTGKVESAEYNDKLSSTKTQSLISLAIRKSKEFWFEKNRTKEMCGVIVYKVKGS